MIDIEIIAKKIGIAKNEFEEYGHRTAKISISALKRLKGRGTLVLVTAMTPTPSGEGKTTTAIGLCDGLNRLGKRSIVTLRQPSLGVFFGMKGGATGGGKSTVEPSSEINMHFTGDSYAIMEAHDLLSALVENHIYQGNKLQIDKSRISWPRTLDIEDRALRKIIVGKDKLAHEGKFVITAASEIMSILSLAENEKDLRERLARIIVAYDKKGRPITAKQLKADGAMALLLQKAFLPNLVQTQEGNAALIHGGAFANVSIGTNSLIATQMALALAGNGFVITETGFGSELGLEKFIDIVAQQGNLQPRVAVIVATTKAIKQHGLENLFKHVENVEAFGLIPVVAINRFSDDKKEDLEKIMNASKQKNIAAAVVECFEKGGIGTVALAKEVIKASKQKTKMQFSYLLSDPIKTKIEKIAKEIYGAKDVQYSKEAEKGIRQIEKEKLANSLPICIAKTQLSLSDDKKLSGKPKGFVVHVKDVQLLAGAGFVLVKMGDILLMPGLPLHPAAERMEQTSRFI